MAGADGRLLSGGRSKVPQISTPGHALSDFPAYGLALSDENGYHYNESKIDKEMNSVETLNRVVAAKKASGAVLEKLTDLYDEALAHDGFAEIRVEIRILRRGQKEVILHCGKQYRFVVDYVPGN